ncbi:hypothetical protein NOX90_05410 [Wolbachia endosymbiont of Anurida maritima]|uniref:hypothetical protein n=1 Tax=Wolbachia endosymbiont of Anurida maritima TaxID=2850562 RepID=UPI0035CEFC96
MINRVKRKLVQSTEFDQPYPLRKKRKTEAKTIQELCDPTLTDIRLGGSDSQQIFENIKNLAQLSYNQEYNFVDDDFSNKTDKYESDNQQIFEDNIKNLAQLIYNQKCNQVICADSLLPENSFFMTTNEIKKQQIIDQQIFKSNDPTKFSLNQGYNFAKDDLLNKTDEHESDNRRQNSSDHGSDGSSADRRLTESSDGDSNSSCSSDYSYFSEDGSLLMDPKIPLTENEGELIDQFFEEMEDVKEENNKEIALRFIQDITQRYLRKGIRLNALYGRHDKTVTNLVFEEVMHATLNEGMSPANRKDHSDCDKEVLSDESKKIMREIIDSLLSEGGKVKEYIFSDGELGHVTLDSNYTNSILAKCGKIKNNLKNVAYESIVNKNKQTQKR